MTIEFSVIRICFIKGRLNVFTNLLCFNVHLEDFGTDKTSQNLSPLPSKIVYNQFIKSINTSSVWYRISGIFRVGLIFAEFATSLKSLKINTEKNKPYYTSSLRVHEIAKIGLREIQHTF